jgi:hypothetical protein
VLINRSDFFKDGGTSILGLHHRNKFLPRAAILQPFSKLSARRVGNFSRQVEDQVNHIGRTPAVQHINRFR